MWISVVVAVSLRTRNKLLHFYSTTTDW